MKRKYKKLLIGTALLCLVVIIFVLILNYIIKDSKEEKPEEKKPTFKELFKVENEEYKNEADTFTYSATIKPLGKEEVYLENLCVNILDETNGTMLSYSERVDTNLNDTVGYNLTFSNGKLSQEVSKVEISLCE